MKHYQNLTINKLDETILFGEDVTFEGCIFSHVDFSHLDFSGSRFVACMFEACIFRRTNFGSEDLGTIFQYCTFFQSEIICSAIKQVTFEDCKMFGCSLVETVCEDTKFLRVVLSDTRFVSGLLCRVAIEDGAVRGGFFYGCAFDGGRFYKLVFDGTWVDELNVFQPVSIGSCVCLNTVTHNECENAFFQKFRVASCEVDDS